MECDEAFYEDTPCAGTIDAYEYPIGTTFSYMCEAHRDTDCRRIPDVRQWQREHGYGEGRIDGHGR